MHLNGHTLYTTICALKRSHFIYNYLCTETVTLSIQLSVVPLNAPRTLHSTITRACREGRDRVDVLLSDKIPAESVKPRNRISRQPQTTRALLLPMLQSPRKVLSLSVGYAACYYNISTCVRASSSLQALTSRY